LALVLVMFVQACLPAGSGEGAARPADATLVPPGYGSLHQEDITLTVRVGDLQVKITPLAEWVLRLTAPDTYKRLSGAVARLDEADRVGRLPVLVSLFTEAAGGTEVELRDLVLVSRGRRYRPQVVRGLTLGWGTGRVRQRESQQAIYLFDGDVDLEMDLDVMFGDVRTAEWNVILPRLETERARIRSRVGVSSSQGRTS